MNVSRSELSALRSERRAYAQAINEIREATGLHEVPIAELPAMVEQLLNELADRQIRRDIEQHESQAGCDEIVVQGLDTVRGFPAGDPEDDEWSPEDTVVPSPAQSCRGCLRLVELDGRLTCSEARSTMAGATLVWPGPGCVWASDADKIYGR